MKYRIIPLLLTAMLFLQACQTGMSPHDPQNENPIETTVLPDDDRTYWGLPAKKQFTVEFTGEGLSLPEELEAIYYDAYFTYSLSCLSSSYYFILFDDGTRQPLVEAISTGQVSIEDCIANGLSVFAETKLDDGLNSGWLCMGDHYQFIVNDQPFYPSIYFMMKTTASETYFLFDELVNTLTNAGLSKAAEGLIHYNEVRDIKGLAGRLYYSVEMLEEAGLMVFFEHNENWPNDRPIPVCFVFGKPSPR